MRLRPDAMYSSARWLGDEIFAEYAGAHNRFIDRAGLLIGTLQAIHSIACRARSGIVNNPPDYFRRSFVVSIHKNFVSLTGSSSTSAPFINFETAAWNTAVDDPNEASGERLIKQLRKLERRAR